jgi:hypothetical protein
MKTSPPFQPLRRTLRRNQDLIAANTEARLVFDLTSVN